MSINIEIHADNDPLIPIEELQNLLVSVWTREFGGRASITIVLTDDERVRELNRAFLDKDKYTDVLAFPLSQGDPFEGEVYISIDRVNENAKHYECSPAQELRRVTIHAILHFLGYDDKTPAQKRVMTEKEDFFLRSFD